MNPIELSTKEREQLLDAIEDALWELNAEPVAEYVSQPLLDKLEDAKDLLEDV